jgi:hypothetical protein
MQEIECGQTSFRNPRNINNSIDFKVVEASFWGDVPSCKIRLWSFPQKLQLCVTATASTTLSGRDLWGPKATICKGAALKA